jgi:hypothetical protein
MLQKDWKIDYRRKERINKEINFFDKFLYFIFWSNTQSLVCCIHCPLLEAVDSQTTSNENLLDQHFFAAIIWSSCPSHQYPAISRSTYYNQIAFFGSLTVLHHSATTKATIPTSHLTGLITSETPTYSSL